MRSLTEPELAVASYHGGAVRLMKTEHRFYLTVNRRRFAHQLECLALTAALDSALGQLLDSVPPYELLLQPTECAALDVAFAGLLVCALDAAMANKLVYEDPFVGLLRYSPRPEAEA